ncbi:hypothetical protein [Streptacidiphilus melanogenes]|uniref:hypothetical protein n=1 Tax=Streptacidiphilus melanogenes TaxID=411235 RepID=UPI0005A7F9E4|nr:hypothetical protein [Streptacidiphilus melanogenes]
MSRHDSGHEGGMANRGVGDNGLGNKGIIISGGTVSDSALVAGENNRVTVQQRHDDAGTGQALARARADAARLVELLASGGYDLPDAPTAHAAALGLKDELDEQEPDQSRLRKWLTRLRGLVAGVAPLAELVVAVEESVRMLLGG